ncbi:fasciclin domain-containing protein [Pontibacter korlensis]|uniref:FAS1 domain-containing protein n=1 Tax=Pontibacter korlensis TaxID=400092 RepID=A0A0E3ZFE9_9BACT|nr:fasciclin domain-containing protein [Pontibacter korlensis]AKD02830.1 hypothetical protein PKOR_06440 [Pontibacter korlensis]
MRLLHKYTHTKLLLIALFLLCWQAGQAQENASMMEYVIKERPVLAGLLTKAGFAPILSVDTPVTLLAPPEAALQSIATESPERLKAILSNHILKGAHQEKDLKDGETITSICGTSLTIYRKSGKTLVNGIAIQRANLQVKNGVVHELASLLEG